jgi:hypothetical protein
LDAGEPAVDQQWKPRDERLVCRGWLDEARLLFAVLLERAR